jgi:signal transduction histidine kinase
VARIQQELTGLSRLVEDFLDYARHRAPDLEPVDGARLVEEVRELCLPLAEGRGVALQAAGQGAFLADRHLLRRAALNLARNAIEASPQGGAVALDLAVAGGEVSLTVLDRGPGLPPEARARLFEPFCTTKSGGTGLGLALARKAALAHGGRLDLDDREGGGTAARLRVPLRAPAGEGGA